MAFTAQEQNMTAMREKTEKSLRFEITAPVAMVLSGGKMGFGTSADAAMWLKFSVCPKKFPNRQEIYLVPKEEETDSAAQVKGIPRFDVERWRRLTSETEGLLEFHRQPQTDQEAYDEAKRNIGELSHCPKSSGSAEFYFIKINLPENEFRQTLDAFLTGKPPQTITIWTPDVEYGSPDSIVWEVWDAYSTFATIVGFNLSFSTDIPRVGVGLKKTENDEENDTEETTKLKEAILHSREDIQLLCCGQANMNSAIAGLRKQTNVLIAVAIIIAVILTLGFKW
jgi:hypothetical protein